MCISFYYCKTKQGPSSDSQVNLVKHKIFKRRQVASIRPINVFWSVCWSVYLCVEMFSKWKTIEKSKESYLIFLFVWYFWFFLFFFGGIPLDVHEAIWQTINKLNQIIKRIKFVWEVVHGSSSLCTQILIILILFGLELKRRD